MQSNYKDHGSNVQNLLMLLFRMTLLYNVILHGYNNVSIITKKYEWPLEVRYNRDLNNEKAFCINTVKSRKHFKSKH